MLKINDRVVVLNDSIGEDETGLATVVGEIESDRMVMVEFDTLPKSMSPFENNNRAYVRVNEVEIVGREIKTGETVVVMNTDSIYYNYVGIVKVIEGSSRLQVGVEFSSYRPEGNKLSGRIKDGYGYYFHSNEVEVVGREFKTGDTVLVMNTDSPYYNYVGIVKVIEDRNRLEVGVEFSSSRPEGHTLIGRVKDGYGYYFHSEELVVSSNFKIDDRVEVVNEDSIANGITGTVKELPTDGLGYIGVALDEKVRHNHTLDGKCKAGYGWYVSELNLKLIKYIKIKEFKEGVVYEINDLKYRINNGLLEVLINSTWKSSELGYNDVIAKQFTILKEFPQVGDYYYTLEAGHTDPIYHGTWTDSTKQRNLKNRVGIFETENEVKAKAKKLGWL